MKVKLLNWEQLPTKKYPEDAGWDVFSNEYFILEPGTRRKVPLGFCVELEPGTYGHIEGKSGRAFKEGLTTIGNIIDSTYRGEVHAILLNTGDQPITVGAFEKIAQLVISPVIISNYKEVKELSETDRGDQGFGSTGLTNETSTVQSSS